MQIRIVMKRYIFTIVYMLVALSLAAQSEQLNGAPANVEAVDLGLPSGTRWASCNVGATKPEEFGGYFAWGETEAKIEYLLENYKYKDVDLGNDICGTPYDVAHVKWGKNWRMPTLKEIEELVDNCTYTVTELNFVQVMKMTGPNGNSIYLPFTGYMDGTECTSIGHGSGYYWSGVNTYTNTFAPCMTPSASGNISYNNAWNKYLGLMVRPVLNVVSPVPRTFIDLGLPSGTKWANMNVGASRPEEYGKYFAWGETGEKDSYTWDNYMCPELTCGKSGDPVFDLVGDKADITGTKFDAATIHWGASWNMPTAEQVEELASNCYSSLVIINGVQCRKLKSQINGNEIIFPLSGARWNEDFAYEGSLGYYWSSTLRQGGYVSPCRLIVRDDTHGWGWSMGGENDRFCAFPIRPVFVEVPSTEDTITYHKFSVAFNDDGIPEKYGSGVSFQRNGDSDSYSLSIDGQQSNESTFDISKVSYISRKNIGKVSLPEESGLSENDLTITVDGDTITIDDKGVIDVAGSTLIATNSEGEVVYMNIAAVEDANNATGADLNAKESAITLMLPLVPNIFVAFDDEQLPHLKEMIWDVEEVKQLAAAIDRSVAKYGYTDFGEISSEATAARNKISELLHLEKLAEKQAESASLASKRSMRNASGSKEPPYIVNTYGFGGLQVEITDSEKKNFYHPYNITGYNCEVTAYNYNRFAYSSMVKGKYDAETDTYYIPDLGDDYEYYKNILKPQKVSTFMNTFTSFKYEDLERLGQFLEESVDLVQGDIGFDEMHWSDMKKSAYFDISAQDDAIVLLFPRGNDYMMVYNIIQSVVKPIVKIISKKASKYLDDDVVIPILCEQLFGDPDYMLNLKSVLNDPELGALEKIEEITSITWTKFFKALDKVIQSNIDEAIKESFSDFVDKTVDEVGGYDAAEDWKFVKGAFKYLSWVKKIGDVVTGTLGTFFENNAVYPIYWEANGQFVLEKNAVTVGEGEDINVRILVGSGSYFGESSDEKVATVISSYNTVKIHGVDAGNAVITVKDKIAQKTAKISVLVTGVQNFVLAESEVSVPMYKDRSVTIERGDGPFHISGGDEKIAVAKLGGGNPIIFPGEKYAVVISGVSEGSTTFNVYNEATDQTLPLTVNVTAEDVVITDDRIVDLGLSVKWANCNVGSNSPEEYGDYFAWGEVETKDYYSLNNYKYYSSGNFVDIGSDISGTAYDAATHNMGGDWRMPTKAEYEELINKCEWKFVTYRRKRGWKVTGPSGNSIFLPVAGNMLDDWNDYASIGGFYWSSNITDNHREVYSLYTTMSDYQVSYRYMNCYEGRTIRAVTGTNDDPDQGNHEWVDLGLPSGTLWATCNVGASKPEEVGNFYAWGEILPKQYFDWNNYSFCEGSEETCLNIGNDISGTIYDVAHMTWTDNWRMPNKEEIQELIDNCNTWEDVENGIYGWRFSSRKNDNSIFIPYCEYEKEHVNDDVVEDPFYSEGIASLWSSSIATEDNSKAVALQLYDWFYCFFGNSEATLYIEQRDSGLCVRPIYSSFKITPLNTIDFGIVPKDSIKEERLLIKNTSYEAHTFYINCEASYYFKLNDDSVFTLAPGEERVLSILCIGLPYKKNKSAQLTIETDTEKRVVLLQGYGGDVSYGENAYAIVNWDDHSLIFYCDDKRDTRELSTYNLNIEDESVEWPSWWPYSYIEKIVFDSSFAKARPTTTYGWFNGMGALTTIEGFQYLNTSEVTNMAYMFSSCSSLTSLDLSHFDTSNVTNMEGMFKGCSGLTSLDLSSFNTSKVTGMSSMFQYCSGLTSLDLSHFDTGKVRDMQWMFFECSNLTSLDLSHFDTGEVTDMSLMFKLCKNIKYLDLSSFDVSHAIIRQMFLACENLETILCSNLWDTNKEKESESMFYSCYKLVGGKGTKYDVNHIDGEYARIDGGPERPGYFTESNATVVPIISVTPTEINFGKVELDTDKTETFTVKNTSSIDVSFRVSFFGGSFDVSDTNEDIILAPGASKVFTITAHGMKRGSQASCRINIKVNSEENIVVPTINAYMTGWDTKPLTLASNSISLSRGEKKEVDIIYGSLNYELICDNPHLFDAGIGTSSISGGGRNEHGSSSTCYVWIEARATAEQATLRIKDKDTGEEVALQVTVDAVDVGAEAVDLGLPSGTRWANFNVGAVTPEEFGGYYAWGETEEKANYDWSTYIHCDGTIETCHDLGSDIIGNYDVAHKKWGWSSSSWQMPSLEQVEELINNCSHEVVTIDNWRKIGIKFVGPSGNSIFMPFTGYRSNNSVYGRGYYGCYWLRTSESSSYLSYDFTIDESGEVKISSTGSRCWGLTVRPVFSAGPIADDQGDL